MDTFGRGYARRQPLTPAEIEALPFLLGLRRAATFINLTGRYLQGPSPIEHMVYGLESTLQAEDWLDSYTPELLRRARRWAT